MIDPDLPLQISYPSPPPSPPGGQMGECKAETLERTESQTLAAQIVARHKNKKEQVRSKCCIVM